MTKASAEIGACAAHFVTTKWRWLVKVPYLQRDGEFRPQIRPHVRALATGGPVRIALSTAGGYEGQIVLRISEDAATFEAALELGDWTRFPARIRAAATELKAQGLLGTFLVGHENGVLTITPAAIAAPMTRQPTSGRRPWVREELIAVMNLYNRLEFGQLHARQPLVIRLAQALGRTPGSVAMKLCNFAALDPAIQASGRKGLQGASELDRAVWREFEADSELMGLESERQYEALVPPTAAVNEPPAETDDWTDRETTEVERSTLQRQGQDYFRRAVLVSYGHRCCITGIPLPPLLVASHIVAWAEDRPNRLNPRNGLCLAKTQDAAFDQHLITLDEQLRVVLSRSLRDHFTCEALRVNFAPYEGQPITLPYRYRPDEAFLGKHRAAFAAGGG